MTALSCKKMSVYNPHERIRAGAKIITKKRLPLSDSLNFLVAGAGLPESGSGQASRPARTQSSNAIKKRLPLSDSLNFLVAGAGLEPTTFGL